MNLICLIIWVILGIWGVVHVVKNERVHPFTYLYAVIVCICSYLEKLLTR